MKNTIKNITTLMLIVISLSSFSQNYLDFMGMPTTSQNIYNNNNKSVNDLLSVDIISGFKSPTDLPSGLAYDGQYLWVCGYNEYKIYKISTIDGSIISTIPINLQRPYGITYDNNTIYLIDNISKNIFAYNTLTGACIDTFITNNPVYPTGLYKLNGDFIYNDTKGPQPSITGDSTFYYNILNNNTTGNSAFGTYNTGITFDGTYLWINDNPSQSSMKIDPTSWTLVNSYKLPGGMYPNGITWDGQHLWEINNASDSIYMLEVDNATLVSNNVSNSSINVYPNLINKNDNININFKNTKINSIIIYDINGNELVNMSDNYDKNNSATINNNLSSGIYFVCCKSDSKIYTNKLIVK